MSDRRCEHCGEPSYPSWPCGCGGKVDEEATDSIIGDKGIKPYLKDKGWVCGCDLFNSCGTYCPHCKNYAPGIRDPKDPDNCEKDLYYELLYAVGKKYPGESRHETALRYILSAETGSNIAGCEKSNEEG